MNSYCFTIDTGDGEGFASLFEHGTREWKGTPPIRGKQEAGVAQREDLSGRDAEVEVCDLERLRAHLRGIS